MKISLIIPVYNEEKIIKSTLEKLHAFVKKEKDDLEILIINDGSTDNTLEIIEDFKPKFFKIISCKKNKGKGFAIKRGVKEAFGDYICFTDADLAYSFDNLKSILSQLKFFDVTIGSRSLHTDNHESIKILRRIVGRGSSMVSNALLRYNIRDTQCGLKAFKKNVAKDLFSKITIKGFYFDPEILYIARKRGYAIKEERVVVLKNHQSRISKVNVLKDSIRCFLDLLIIKLNDIRGKYG